MLDAPNKSANGSSRLIRENAQASSTILVPGRADGGDCALPWQGKSSHVSIYLSAQVECASRVSKTARAAGY
jgi:hypothetical protein